MSIVYFVCKSVLIVVLSVRLIFVKVLKVTSSA
jgi:hypothetical protein